MPWHNQNTYGFLRTSQEAHDNADMIYYILHHLGWGTAAVCAMLGNVEAESNYNPWRWQNEQILSSTDTGVYQIGLLCGDNTGHAYGLCQSDPAANYIYRPVSQGSYGYGPNYSDIPGSVNDGTAQMVYLDWVCREYTDGSCGGWSNTYHDAIPFSQFAAQEDLSNYTIAQLTKIFHDGYERSQNYYNSQSTREGAAAYWWNYFGGDTPPDPPPDPPPLPPEPPTPQTFPYFLLLWQMNKVNNKKPYRTTTAYRR